MLVSDNGGGMVESGSADGVNQDGLAYLEQLMAQAKGSVREELGTAAAQWQDAVEAWRSAREKLSTKLSTVHSLRDQARENNHPAADRLNGLMTAIHVVQSQPTDLSKTGAVAEVLKNQNSGLTERVRSMVSPTYARQALQEVIDALRQDTARIGKQSASMREDLAAIEAFQKELDTPREAGEARETQDHPARRIAGEMAGRLTGRRGARSGPGPTQPSRAPVPRARDGRGASKA
ncbi:hypothetical protein [Streptomonospora nanhaiensis]|uniref:Chromosome segregation ATPase n=1 Tax=Streptomonospora nanhaiensis TaxID=1323731 RepID=A0A853BMU8_9ACTN|nr:hypothetical protein [Streptomonospora nanhaiensis]MBV2366648.1 hypothetical protein [Streptomonospora nanhaiensis]NYI95851.1 chromosome segregation ATPase [Streptomonospora nanhaiensis]